MIWLALCYATARRKDFNYHLHIFAFQACKNLEVVFVWCNPNKKLCGHFKAWALEHGCESVSSQKFVGELKSMGVVASRQEDNAVKDIRIKGWIYVTQVAHVPLWRNAQAFKQGFCGAPFMPLVPHQGYPLLMFILVYLYCLHINPLQARTISVYPRHTFAFQACMNLSSTITAFRYCPALLQTQYSPMTASIWKRFLQASK